MEEGKKKIVGARPIYKKLLIAAIIIYIVGTAIIQIDICCRIGKIEHDLFHLSGGRGD